MSDPDLPSRMREASQTILEVSQLFGRKFPEMSAWSALGLRHEADALDDELCEPPRFEP